MRGGGVGITANTKILGHLTANSKNSLYHLTAYSEEEKKNGRGIFVAQYSKKSDHN